MSDNNKEIKRRTILKSVGMGSAIAAPSLLVKSARAEGDKSPETVKKRVRGKEAKKWIDKATGSSQFEAVLSKSRKNGFDPNVEAAEVIRFSTDFTSQKNSESDLLRRSRRRRRGVFPDNSNIGVVVPLELTIQEKDVWEKLDISTEEFTTVGYAVWTLRSSAVSAKSGESESAQSFILAVEEGTAQFEDIHSVIDQNRYSMENVGAVKVITPDSVYSGSFDGVGGNGTSPSQRTVSAMSHDVDHCYFENNDILEHGDDAITCGACAFPGDGLLIGDVAQCLWCVYQAEKAACLLGYCMDESGGSTGDTFCDIVDTIASSPIDMLPIKGGTGLKLTAQATWFGCITDEATDCTAPLTD